MSKLTLKELQNRFGEDAVSHLAHFEPGPGNPFGDWRRADISAASPKKRLSAEAPKFAIYLHQEKLMILRQKYYG